MLYILSVFTILSPYAQDVPGDRFRTIQFRVEGNCGMCQSRIEEASRGRGVRETSWNNQTRLLHITFDTVLVNLQTIQKRIIQAGHDIGNEKAGNRVYEELPACCHYREGTMEELERALAGKEIQDSAFLKLQGEYKSVGLVRGIVLESDSKGNFIPLHGASVTWLQTTLGTATDSNGVFSISRLPGVDRLVVSYTGHTSDTIAINPIQEIKVVLASNNQLNEVKVMARQRSLYYGVMSPVRTLVMTEKELFKAACCNLSESFETNPSVDVSYNDAVTGSKQIQLLGLSGNYTQLTIENLPGPRGIATPLGLNSIPGPWIESIQLTKGVGSVANGFESIAGQINVELKKPGSEKLYLNGYVNEFGKTDINLNLSRRVSRTWSTTLLLHEDFLANRRLDMNKDGFRDLPYGNLFTLFNRWKYDNAKGLLIQAGVKYLSDDKTGGQVTFDPEQDKFSTRHYGLGINIKRYEIFGKIGYVFPGKKYKSLGWQLSSFRHDQEAYFGLSAYTARQDNFYSNFIYQSIIGTTDHKFRTGFSVVLDRYREKYRELLFSRREMVPGAFIEYSYNYLDKFSVVAGIRVDHNNLYGWFSTPRIHARYEPFKGTIIRVSGGRGQRTANIFSENVGMLASSREIMLPVERKRAYGLDPEVAWNEGMSVDQKFRLFGRNGTLGVDFFRTDFVNQVVVDVDRSAREIHFSNLDGKSFSNSFQTELNYEVFKKIDFRLAYRWFDVRTNYHGKLMERPLIARHRAFANLAWEHNGWKLDYTITYNGVKRIPGTSENIPVHQLPAYSPDFITMNGQVSKSFGKKHSWDLYFGGENLGNFYQQSPILGADQPFGPYFDASLIWGPLSGRMFYTGFRFKIK